MPVAGDQTLLMKTATPSLCAPFAFVQHASHACRRSAGVITHGWLLQAFSISDHTVSVPVHMAGVCVMAECVRSGRVGQRVRRVHTLIDCLPAWLLQPRQTVQQ
jgi:hypothetical protein